MLGIGGSGRIGSQRNVNARERNVNAAAAT